MKRSILGLILFLILFYFFYLKDYRYNRLIKEGNKIVVKISKYKRKEGKLPNSLNDLGIDIIDESDPELCYMKIDGNNFILSFSISIDETYFYYSDSKKWEYGFRKME